MRGLLLESIRLLMSNRYNRSLLGSIQQIIREHRSNMAMQPDGHHRNYPYVSRKRRAASASFLGLRQSSLRGVLMAGVVGCG